MSTSTRAPTPNELARAAEVADLCAAVWAKEPSARCFGHLRIRSGGRVRDLLLGSPALVTGSLALLDWERAPLATVFLAHTVDDEYELELEPDKGRSVEGMVLARELLVCVDHELRVIDDGVARLVRGPGTEWAVETPGPAPLQLRDVADRCRASSPIEVVLDPVQRAAVELEADRSLLVLGEAGFGKTTVALHRVAVLCERAKAEPRAFAALVLVPTRGLRRLVVALLDRLGAPEVEVRTYEQWIARQGRRVFGDLPARDSEAAPPAVARIKRHPALREVLPEIVAGTAVMREVEAGYRDDETPRARDPLLHLFGDRAVLERVAARSGGAITKRMIDQVVAHTRVQFSPTTEHAMADVDADRLRTIDGLAIDAGTPLHDAETLDVEDFAVLFELLHRRTGADATVHGALAHYDHIVLDEAQEFAPIELAVIGRALTAQGSITIAGDEQQQVDETVVFSSWPEVTTELGVADRCERVVLRESYRCPAQVEAFARTLVSRTTTAPDANADTRPSAGPDDPALAICVTAHELELVSRVIAGVQEIRSRDRLASVAVVCRFGATARRMYGLLSPAVDCRLVVDGDFRFGPGVSVTCVDEVKGLEFDYVIVPDATPANYPDTATARRALYVATTRALARLWLLASGRASPLLRGASTPKPWAG